MRKIIIAVSALCFLLPLNAQKKWSLRECIEYAQENNIEIKQQVLDVENSEVELSTSKNSRLPDLNASVGASYNMGRSLMSNNTYQDYNTSGMNLGVTSSTPLFTGFRITNEIKVKDLNLKAATEGLNKAKDNMELKIASLYLDVLFNKELLKVYEEQVTLTKDQVGKTEILVNSGKNPKSQLYDIKAQLANDEANVVSAKNSLDLSLLNLSQALNLMENQDFDIEEPEIGDNFIEANMSSLVSPNQIYQTAIEVKPHVREAEYKLESSKKSLKVAESGYWPTLSLGLGYNTNFQHIYNSGEKNASFGNQFKNNGREYVSLSLNIPIFNRFQTRNQVRQARLGVLNSELVIENVKLNLYKEIQQAYQNALSAESKYKSAEKAFQASEESFRYAKDRYEVGQISVYEYSEAQLKVLRSRSEQLQAKYDFVFRARILDFYAGKQINI